MNREQLAQLALVAYPITSPRITFLRHNENMTFHVLDQQTGDSYLLRVHTPLTETLQGDRLSPEGIVAELSWLEALADETNLTLQRPVHTRKGTLVTTVTGTHGDITCSLLHWIEADPFPSAPLPVHVVGLGFVIATLHTHARTWSVPESFTRPVYDLAFHRQHINKLAQGVLDGIIQEGDFAPIQETLELVFRTLAEAQEPLMLIHADLWRGNLLVSEIDVHPIDFSLCGFGFPAHFRSMSLDAYQRQAPLPSRYARLLDAYFLLSRMGAYVYLLPDLPEHEWLKERIPRFVAQECWLFLEGNPLLLGGPI